MICLKRKPLNYVALALIFACSAAQAQDARRGAKTARPTPNAPLVFLDSTRERDGLKGAVRRVETEVVKVALENGAVVEKSRAVLERTLYDARGRRVANETYPIASDFAGRQTNSYDAQGNLAETIVRDERGATLSRIAYKYEFDSTGNWVKMTASVAVVRGERVEYEPFEITNRTITYYLLDGERAAKAPATATNVEPAKAFGNEEESGAREAVGAKQQETSRREAGGSDGSQRAASRRETLKRETVKRESSDLASQRGDTKPREGARVAHAEGRTVSIGVLNDRATWLAPVSFPVAGKRLEKPVTISVDVVIDPTGRVVEAKAENGSPAMRQAAEDAARHATFMPYYSEGRPVSVRGWINFGFYFAP